MTTKKILLVDDKEEARHLLLTLLRGFGYEVATATNGAEALESAREVPPDLIVSDILMPVMDGFSLCREWKKDERLRAIPFIFHTTACTDERDREFALGLGAQRFIVKPETPAVLLGIVREMLDRAGSAQASPCVVRERVEAERARLASAVEQVVEGIIIYDANWVVEYVNSGLERITGYDRRQLLGRRSGFPVEECADWPGEAVLEAVGRDGVWAGRILNKRKCGAPFHAEVTISPVRDPGGEIVNYVSVIRDVTLEVNLQKSLRQAEKRECIATLAGGMAHDFNNILMAILGYAEISLDLASDNEELKKCLGQILGAGLRAKELVRQILTFSREGVRELRPVQLALIVKEALTMLRASLPSSIEIRQEIAEDSAHSVILSDPTKIHQVVMNLCVNGAHAMRGKGGILSLGLRKMDLDARAVAGRPGLSEGAYICLAIKDTGCGIDSGTLDKIFDPYFTTKAVGEGAGIGLFVAQTIVRGSGGVIEVESEPGQGTVFHIWFPDMEEDEGPAVEAMEKLPAGKERSLFVDDEELLAELGREMLESLGYRVRTELRSPDALETFKADPLAFDLVITDVTMPHFTGTELAGRILEVRPDIPILLCTGLSEHIVARETGGKAEWRVITKPYTVAALARAVREALDHRERSNTTGKAGGL